eukprot:CAMPEP_0196662258 /NCGR_PEP_ID=MMETSP1086-20130531/47884_1 /TAXON_ID=77921 /ORGANISM="Cyanoptyche  gloeocystis , Strain SAG4.97" /LENGTH=186 /DNA_ID=CAMNT_0041997533 /DNA_START=44 /DNA_END=601 /DNA_ORIENTATION=-
MAHLAQRIKRYFPKTLTKELSIDEELGIRLKIVFLGLENSGKTSLVYKFCGADLNFEPVSTANYNVIKFTHSKIPLDLVDVGGNKTLRTFWSQHFDDVCGCVFVVDSGDPSRFDVSSDELQRVLTHDKLAGVPVLILFNKRDSEFSKAVSEAGAAWDLSSKMDSRRWIVYECSAHSGQNVSEAFAW